MVPLSIVKWHLTNASDWLTDRPTDGCTHWLILQVSYWMSSMLMSQSAHYRSFRTLNIFQWLTCTGTGKLTRTTNRQNTHKNEVVQRSQNGPRCEQHKKPRLRERSDRAWFNRLLWHPARKQSGSILITAVQSTGPEPRNPHGEEMFRNFIS